MKKFKTICQKFVRDEEGATAVEYAVMLVLIIVVCIAVVTTLGENTRDSFQVTANALNQ